MSVASKQRICISWIFAYIRASTDDKNIHTYDYKAVSNPGIMAKATYLINTTNVFHIALTYHNHPTSIPKCRKQAHNLAESLLNSSAPMLTTTTSVSGHHTGHYTGLAREY